MFTFKHIPQYAIDAATRPEVYECQGEADEVVENFVEDEMLTLEEKISQATTYYRRGFSIEGGFDHAAAVGLV